ncbi:hypothetical protein SAMN02745248_02760 [Hathewaya proteolytica DSM 3090]|uniref:Lactate dehydrogenase n=1 Tax=Hathewaya proteolytica DSM 3090 TaxID=1121331 RepID=A0A1M6T8V7_9CLOT|nr:NAD(P)-dependent oxidoreductase [Hathewaya proteolytica]SHK53482.1 hypothetical protein SAMN02745248_02760 [Hathewaya proteolytica DSM 3090]
MKFKKIVAVDYTGIEEFVGDKLKELCDEIVLYNDIPDSDDEIVKRMKDADCMLVSWNTKISEKVITSLSKLKYIGMCCTLYDEKSANVDVMTARRRNIYVIGVSHYGDKGVIEYIFSELIRLFKGTGTIMFRNEQIELEDIKLGIIGLGTVGNMVAEAADFFGMKIFYNNRHEKEHCKYTYLSKEQLLKQCDIISVHLPRNTVVLGEEEFKTMGGGKVLINTGLSPCFEEQAFFRWIDDKENFAIFDGVSATGDFRKKCSRYSNIIMTPVVTGFTKNARRRLAMKVVANITEFLNCN